MISLDCWSTPNFPKTPCKVAFIWQPSLWGLTWFPFQKHIRICRSLLFCSSPKAWRPTAAVAPVITTDTESKPIKHGKSTLPRFRFRENESLSCSVDITSSLTWLKRENGVTLMSERVLVVNSSRSSPVSLQSRRRRRVWICYSYYGEDFSSNIHELSMN